MCSSDLEDRGRVIGGGEPRVRVAVVEDAAVEFTTVLGESEVAAEERLRGGRAQANDYFRFYDEDLGLQPGTTGLDLAGGWFFVETPFAARLPAEMFHGVGDVDFAARDAGGVERFIEQATGGADEGVALPIFRVAGHFADEHQTGAPRAFAEDGLRGVFVELAPLAMGGGFAERFEVEPRGEEFGGGDGGWRRALLGC